MVIKSGVSDKGWIHTRVYEARMQSDSHHSGIYFLKLNRNTWWVCPSFSIYVCFICLSELKVQSNWSICKPGPHTTPGRQGGQQVRAESERDREGSNSNFHYQHISQGTSSAQKETWKKSPLGLDQVPHPHTIPEPEPHPPSFSGSGNK
jgi:hypothetical protein